VIETGGQTADGDPGALRVGRSIHVRGIVQGVGFRPFVHALARELGLAGWVANDVRGVTIEVEGRAAAVAELIERLEREAPPLARIEAISVAARAPEGWSEFRILASRAGGEREAAVSADAATCEDCLRELFDPAGRRYRYPFVNCTACGPRFTIVREVPYDRRNTTMAEFAMCADCEREYDDPADRRFHAQPIACPACGPRLALVDASGRPLAGDPLGAAVARLRDGAIVAVKGLGGYHLAADAGNESAVARLRGRKHREDKPFAVLAPDLAAARALARIDAAEERILAGPRRPIVLLDRLPGASLAPSVAPHNRRIGLMLPYTPLHHVMARDLATPLVLTSGNVSDEPIAYRDGDALARLAAVADAFLVHDRPIHVRADDSVVRVHRGREMPIRRSRGYAPEPLALPIRARSPILACGAELKSTFCLAKGQRAFLSHHVGDLENWETLHAFGEGIAHFRRLFDVTPEVVAFDLHPEYLSTKHALSLEGVRRVGVQHHHAHVASCLADNGETGPAIGVAFDGLGWGTDGTIWGGEVLVADLRRFERAAHLETVALPGGAAAIREPWRMAAAWLARACGGEIAAQLAVVERHRERWQAILRLAASRVSLRTSSAGRLFDAVAAILGVRDEVHYEGQAAAELEQLADESERGAYRSGLEEAWPILIRGSDLVRAIVADLGAGVAAPVIAARFHNGLALAVVATCVAVRDRSGLGVVALSGGVFQNAWLLARVEAGLRRAGFRVLVHARVPCNDAGISFGQAAVAAAQQEGE
jgi:hydrogenase maturation protein HypF